MSNIKLSMEIEDKVIADLFTIAIESGDPVTTAKRGGWCAGVYWQDTNTHWPDNTTERGVYSYADPALYGRPDFKLLILEVDDETVWDGECEPGAPGIKAHTVTRADIQRGLEALAKTKHIVDVVNDNMDACTADMFLQLMLFGKETYA